MVSISEYELAKLVAAEHGNKFPIRHTLRCKHCHKNFMWKQYRVGHYPPSMCPEHQGKKPFSPHKVTSSCLSCGKQFTWQMKFPDQKPRKRCSEHSDGKDGKKKSAYVKCPTPDKPKLSSKKEADKYRRDRVLKYQSPLDVYKCQCGHWHVTSQIRKRRIV